MHDARSFLRRVGLLSLASLPLLLPLACAPDLTGGLTGSGVGSGGGGGVVPGSGGAGGAGASGDPALCGNGQLDPGEDCDDGNLTPGDGCTGCIDCNDPGDFFEPATWHCYTYVTSSDKSWSAARNDCQARGGDLAAISTPAEYDYLDQKMTTDVWLGGSDQALECVFSWTNGEPWYPRWSADAPNDFLGNEECVVLVDGGQFNDSNCSTMRDYLCERAPRGGCGDALVQPGEECDDGNATAGDGCDGCQLECKANEVKNPMNLHCYRFMPDAITNWDGARNNCIGSGSYLATVTTPEEAAFIKMHQQGNMWIGMRWFDAWTWSTDEPNCWANWAAGQPSSVAGENCVESLLDGRWNNTECNQVNAYVCERSPLGN